MTAVLVTAAGYLLLAALSALVLYLTIAPLVRDVLAGLPG